MKFGRLATGEAAGTVLAHSLAAGSRVLKKGHALTAADVASLQSEGIMSVVVAQMEPGDVSEDEAASQLAKAICGANVSLDSPFTGRVNLYAVSDGLLDIDADAVNRFNRVDPAITLATLPQLSAVQAGRMVATVKIIPLAVPGASLEAGLQSAQQAVSIRPFRPRKVGLVATKLTHLKPATMDKTRRVLAERLAPLGGQLLDEIRTAHDAEGVADGIDKQLAAGAELVVLFGASAVVDRADVLPTALERAGGEIIHLGMPVDPGNLLLLGKVKDVPVLGAPGCARSPRENGFDWILQRLMADMTVSPDDITGLGVGGLLMEITSRPQLREQLPQHAPRYGAVVLAAGRSSRMTGGNKLLAELNGKTLVAHALRAATASKASDVVLVTGHMAEAVEAQAAGMNVICRYNPDFASGMASSIRAGIEALPAGLDGAVILLGDMPGITPEMVNRLIDTHDRNARRLIIISTAEGKRGNPVLFDAAYFDALRGLSGDIGARHLIGQEEEVVFEVELGAAARLDLDTREALAAAGGKMNAD